MMHVIQNIIALLAIQISIVGFCICNYIPPIEEQQGSYWVKKGQEALKSSLNLKQNNGIAKNVIFFLGDGMGIPSVTAIRIYKGQKARRNGESEQLSFDKFPYVSLVKTYALDRQNPDSANTATAYFCGVKANFQTIGLDGRVRYGDCQTSLNKETHVDSVLKWAQDEGKLTGFVTSTRVTHATPAGLYAHIAHRNWEAETVDKSCSDIATQLVRDSPGKDINVILGGGSQTFLPSNVKDSNGELGNRSDTSNLLIEWLESKQSAGLRAQYVGNYEEFSKINSKETDFLLGLFNASHLPFVTDRPTLKSKVPTLVDLTKKAIQILEKGPKGYFLAVEGGKIDLAHHECWAKKALEEGVEFDEAIQAAIEMTDEQETLIIVTADHSHTFSIGGEYPQRGNDITGIGGVSKIDDRTFTTLLYGNGPGHKVNRSDNLTEEDTADPEYRNEAAVPLQYETHGAEDVAVYATGPKAHLFHGVQDQSYIPYVIGYATCTGPNKDLCKSAATFTVTPDKNILIVMLMTVYLNV